MTEQTFVTRLRRYINDDIEKTIESITGNEPATKKHYRKQIGCLVGLRKALGHIDTVMQGEEIDLEEDD